MISPKLKKILSSSIPFRFFIRIKSRKPEIRFSIELTTKCNCKCSMCTREKLIKNKNLCVGEMNEKIIKNIKSEIKKFKKAGYKIAITPMGLGEPLLYNNLWKFFKDIKKIDKKIKLILVTNGILLNEKNIKKIISSKIDEINISLNGRNKKEYFKYNGIDAFDLVQENIKKIFVLRKKIKPKIFIQYLNKGDVKWNKFMKKNDKYYVHPIVNQAGFASGIKSNNNYPCNQLSARIAIKINGDIYPCDAALYSGNQKIEELYLGNIKKYSPFAQYTDKKSKRYQILNQMKNNDYKNIKTCKKCSTKNLGINCYFNFFGKWF